MEPTPGAATFNTTGAAYDSFMGRYSRPLSVAFADQIGVEPPMVALDVGCGPGALTGVLVERLGAAAVCACDPSPSFVAGCRAALPRIDVRPGSAESLPFGDETFDAVVAQLVLHFVSDPQHAAAEMQRVVRRGGVVAANVWDFAEGMEMLRAFWDAALALDDRAPDEARVLRFGTEGEIVDLFAAAGLEQCEETVLRVSCEYQGFDELWAGFELGIGPAGAYCVGLSAEARAELRDELFRRLGSPAAGFELSAVARSVTARRPG